MNVSTRMLYRRSSMHPFFIVVVLLLAGIALPAQGTIIAEHWSADTTTYHGVDSQFTMAEAFEVTGAPTVSSVQVYVRRWKGSTGWLRMKLCPDNNGVPGNPTASLLYPVAEIPHGSCEWIPFEWDGSALSSGKWWIVCSVVSGDGDLMWMTSGGNTYGTGGDSITSKDGGATWPIIQKSDNYFKVFGARTNISTITTVTPNPTTVTTSGRTTVTIQVKESPGGDPIQGPGLVNLSATGGTLGDAQVTLTNGTATTTWDAPITTGGYNISASYLGHTYGGSVYQTSSGSGAMSVIVQNRTTTTTQNLSSSTVDTRKSITCSVNVKDNLLNNVPGGKVTFTCTKGVFNPKTANVDANGNASTTWTAGNDVGTFSITASYSGHSAGGVIYGASSDSDDITVNYTDIVTVTKVTVSPEYPYVGGKSWVKVEVKDTSGNAVPGDQVVLAAVPWGSYDTRFVNLNNGKGNTIWNAPVAITGDLVVQADYQQKIANGNKYLASSDTTTIHCVKDPDSSGGAMTYMLEWVGDYKWWQPLLKDLGNTDDDARGFGNKLKDDHGWTGKDYGNDSAQQNHFKLHSLGGKNNDYLDKHDFIYYSGHGDPNFITFNNLNGDSALWSWQADDAWGDGDCEWVLFSACNVMQDDDDWADCFNGAHLQLGYTTEMWDSSTFGGVFAELLTKDNLEDEPHCITQAFFLAGDQCLNNEHKQRVIGENAAMFDDYIWGQGYVNPDPNDDNSYSSISNDVDVNNSPHADAGGPYFAVVGQPVQLDGSNSWDPDRFDTITYAWDMDTSVNTDNDDWDHDGNGAETDDDCDVSGRRPEYTYSTSGLKTIRLMVHDKAWKVATSTTTVNVSPAPGGSSPTSASRVSSPEEEEIEIVDNFDSMTLPTEIQLPKFVLSDMTQGYNEMMNISDYFGVSGQAEVDSVGNFTMVSGDYELIVNQHTGSVIQIDRAQTYRFTRAPGPLPNQATCLAIADGFMNSCGIVRGGAVLDGFSDISMNDNAKGGRDSDVKIPFQRSVNYRRTFTVFPTMNTYPAVGPGGKLKVVIDDYGDPRGFMKVWREVIQGPDIPLIGAMQAVQDFHRLLGKSLYGICIVPNCRRIEINAVSLGYYEDDFVTYQDTIYPVYILDITVETETSSYDTRIFLAAGWNPLESIISAPSDEISINYGQEIVFEGSAAGGTPGYTYKWSSDVDGDLGSGSSLACDSLTVNAQSPEPTMHVICLEVTDSLGVKAKCYVSVMVNPTPLSEAKLLGDGSSIALLGPVVTGCFSDPDQFYVENVDRSSGIGVHSALAPDIGSMVLIHGVMNTVMEERCIIPTSIEIIGPVDPIKPLYVNLRDLGGGDFGVPPFGQRGITDGSGLNNIGLLMKSSGEVVHVYSSTFFAMEIEGEYWTYVILCPQSQCPTVGEFCSVTGVSAIGYRPSDGKLLRLLMTRYPSDLQPVQ